MITPSLTASSQEPRAAFCVPCRELGHACRAQNGIDQCVFCEDGEPCPVTAAAARKAATAPTGVVVGVRSERGAKAKPKNAAKQIQQAPAPAKKEKAMGTGGRIACPECGQEMGRTSVYSHMPKQHGWSAEKAKQWLKSNRAPGAYSAEPNGEVQLCSSGCGTRLRRDNRSGVCKVCSRGGAKPAPKPATQKTAKPVGEIIAKMRTGYAALARHLSDEPEAVATISVTEGALNQWWGKQSIQSKADLFSLAMAEDQELAASSK